MIISIMKYVLSYGGGLNSTTMLVYVIENKLPLDVVVFANTGDEHDYTYYSLDYYKKYCEDLNIRFEVVDTLKKYNIKSMYEYYYNKQITPSRMKRDCTSKFKIAAIRNFLKSNYKNEKFLMYIGIDFSEVHRMRESNVKYIQNNYPLIDAKIDRDNCKRYLKERNLPIPLKSGCYYCPFTKKNNWLKLYRENPDLFKKAVELEENNKRFPEPVSLLSSKPLVQLVSIFNNQSLITEWSNLNNEDERKEKEVEEITCDVVQSSCFL